MRFVRGLRALIVLVAIVASPATWAGAPVVVGITSPDDAYNFLASGLGNSISHTITINFNSNGAPAFDTALLSALAIQGANAADFQILPSSTCVAGTTRLDSTFVPSCTVVIQYHASTAAAETAQLSITCSQVAVAGGFSLTCSPGTGTISLLGSALAAIGSVQAPALDPRVLTLLAILVLGAGTYFAARRN